MNTEGLRILLVDDHQILRDGVRRMLADTLGVLVLGEAGNGTCAMEQVRLLKPDLVVMDIHLPGENGIEVSRRILQEFPRLKIVMLSAEQNLAMVRQALQIGVSAFVTKDRPAEELVQAIRDVLDGRMYLSPAIASVVVQDYMDEVIHKSSPRIELTGRERLLLQRVAEGRRNKEIAVEMHIEVKSVETARSRLMRKLDCASPAELTRYAIREGIIQP